VKGITGLFRHKKTPWLCSMQKTENKGTGNEGTKGPGFPLTLDKEISYSLVEHHGERKEPDAAIY
jgi:hypothetical protein